jgi:hypothetical protein
MLSLELAGWLGELLAGWLIPVTCTVYCSQQRQEILLIQFHDYVKLQ